MDNRKENEWKKWIKKTKTKPNNQPNQNIKGETETMNATEGTKETRNPAVNGQTALK